MTKLVLFDIDGTILNMFGAGTQVLVACLEELLGQPLALEGYSMSGKTDTQIVTELLTRHGGALETLDLVSAAYLAGLAEVMPRVEPLVLPGVRTLLSQVAPISTLGLLTGNLERAAWMKLERVQLAHYFRFGAFGDQAPARSVLPARALTVAQGLTGRQFQGKDIVIVGDTPNDILCGQHLGVRTIAVATGKFSPDQLAAHQPDALFADFSDTGSVLRAMGL